MRALDAAARKAIAAHYRGRRHRGYVRWKLACDPVYAATLDLIGPHPLPILDVGCGLGLLGQYLRAAGLRFPYAGVDHDAAKIAEARVAAAAARLDPPLQLDCMDAVDAAAPPGHVLLLDVLHYLPAARQQALLAALAPRVAAGGLLVIRNVLREPNWRFHATRIEEFFLRTSGWIPGGAQHYPRAEELRAPLERSGLVVRITPLRGRTPYNSYLVVASRPRR